MIWQGKIGEPDRQLYERQGRGGEESEGKEPFELEYPVICSGGKGAKGVIQRGRRGEAVRLMATC